jgi:hypothetical protein
VGFDEALARLGFRATEERAFGRRGVRTYQATPNAFMTYTVHADDDGSATLSWEFAIGDYLGARGMQLGADEPMNQYVYPREDLRGPQDGAWLVSAIEQTEAMLSTVRLDRPE